MANEEVLELQIRDNAAEAATSLWYLARSLERVKNALGRGLNLTATANGIQKLNKAINEGISQESLGKYERLATTLEKIKSVGGIQLKGVKQAAKQLDISNDLNGVKQQAKDTMSSINDAVDMGYVKAEKRTAESMNTVSDEIKQATPDVNAVFDNVLNGMSKIELKQMQLSALEKELQEGIQKGSWDDKKISSWGLRIRSVREEIERMKAASNDRNVGGAVKEIGNAADKTQGRLKALLGDFKRIVKYRMIRSVIKQITQAFVEGTKNVYFFSKAIGTDFAKSMDSAATSFLYLKNSLGAAFSPLIQSLIPMLNTVVDWLVGILNIVNQFISVISGKTTWTKALRYQADAFDDTEKKAKGTGKAIKDLLADWDELNIIQSETGRNSGANDSLQDYTQMFEEVSLPQWLIEWGPVIKAITGGVLGATILPKLFNWLKKILGLGVGDGAKNLLDIAKNFLADKTSKFPSLPDYTGPATQMGIFAGAAAAAGPACEAINEALVKIKGTLEGVGLFKSLLDMLIALVSKSLLGSNIKIRIDRVEYDKFKEDYDAFREQNKEVSIGFRASEYLDFVNKVNAIVTWVKALSEKRVGIGFVADEYLDFNRKSSAITTWTNALSEKEVSIRFTTDTYLKFINQLNAIMVWSNAVSEKRINISFDPYKYAEFDIKAKGITAWTGIDEYKDIIIRYETRGLVDSFAIQILDSIIEKVKQIEEIKNIVIGIVFDWIRYTAFMVQLLSISSWVNKYETKMVGLTFVDDNQILGKITDWIVTPEDKIINLKFNMDEGNPTVDTPVIPENKGDDWGIWDYLKANTNELLNHLIGTDLPEEGWIPSLLNKLLYGDESGNNRGKPIEYAREIELLPEFTGLNDKELNNVIETQIDGLSMNVSVVPEIDDTAVEQMKYQIESESGGIVTFKVDEVKMQPNRYAIPPDEIIAMGNRTLDRSSIGGYGTVNSQYVSPNRETEEKDNAQDASNVETGVRRGTNDMVTVLGDLLAVARAINQKDFKVNITPSSAWGKTNNASNNQYGVVTGTFNP